LGRLCLCFFTLTHLGLPWTRFFLKCFRHLSRCLSANAAVTEVGPSIVTLQGPIPVHPAPAHPAKAEPAAAPAARVTVEPSG
jgi:hypothetical protein